MDPRDEYEFYDEWLNRDDDESSIGLEEYNDMRCIEEYGEDNYFDEDDDSNDKYYDWIFFKIQISFLIIQL